MELNKETMKRIRQLIVFAVAVIVLGVNYQKILVLLTDVVGLISPFLLGGTIAFIVNVPMRGIEKHLPSDKLKHFKRPVGLILTLLAVIGILILVVFVVAPELIRTLVTLTESVPAFLERSGRQLEEFFAAYPDVVAVIRSFEVDWEQIVKNVAGFLTNGAGTMLASTLNAAVSIASGVVNFLVGFVFAVYILLQKETLGRQMSKLLQAFLSEKHYKKVVSVAVLTEKIFSNFLTGQCLEAVILGSMFFIALLILRMPYALLISVLIAFTALIPMFGAFIGCGVGVFLILMVNPVQALIFVAVFLVLQQIEGNFIYPHVVGNSVGLPSIWVLVAVTVGGNAMGVAGMLVFIPLCSVLYALLRESVNSQLIRKNIHIPEVQENEEEIQKTEKEQAASAQTYSRAWMSGGTTDAHPLMKPEGKKSDKVGKKKK